MDTGKLDYLVDMVGEMVIAQSLVRHDPDLAVGLKPRLGRNLSQLARITDEVQRTAMSMRMIPVGQLFQKTSRLVRDLSRKAAKQVELELIRGRDGTRPQHRGGTGGPADAHGAQLGGPRHRDCRRAHANAGKPATARVTLKAGHQAGQIVIQVSDDGRGLDQTKILRKARRKRAW